MENPTISEVIANGTNDPTTVKKSNGQVIPPPRHYVWPIVTDEMRSVVLAQLDASVSIYNRSGILVEFEDNFRHYHQKKYGLLCNSGTNAILSMFVGIGIQPGDEVIVPTYTFFATSSPLAILGAKAVFADVLPDGNINPEEIRKKITPKTKAVIITHMWGIPCEMDEITKICQESGIKLLEDCSHAHGAKYKGQLVGTFGAGSLANFDIIKNHLIGNDLSGVNVLNVAIIGLGKQGEGEYLPNLVNHPFLQLVTVCDNDLEKLQRLSQQYNVIGFEQVETMITSVEIHLAIVSVPHNQYVRIIKLLAEKGIHIFKEKPVACSLSEFKELDQILSNSCSKLGVAVERRYDLLYQRFAEYIAEVGQIRLVEASYTVNASEVTGWRSNYEIARGGVLLDMGYHIVDLLIWYFGKLGKVKAVMNGLGFPKINQGLETNALIQFAIEGNNGSISCHPGSHPFAHPIGHLTLSSTYHEKQERMLVVGSRGHALLHKSTISLFDSQGILLKEWRDVNTGNNNRVWIQVTLYDLSVEKFRIVQPII